MKFILFALFAAAALAASASSGTKHTSLKPVSRQVSVPLGSAFDGISLYSMDSSPLTVRRLQSGRPQSASAYYLLAAGQRHKVGISFNDNSFRPPLMVQLLAFDENHVQVSDSAFDYVVSPTYHDATIQFSPSLAGKWLFVTPSINGRIDPKSAVSIFVGGNSKFDYAPVFYWDGGPESGSHLPVVSVYPLSASPGEPFTATVKFQYITSGSGFTSLPTLYVAGDPDILGEVGAQHLWTPSNWGDSHTFNLQVSSGESQGATHIYVYQSDGTSTGVYASLIVYWSLALRLGH